MLGLRRFAALPCLLLGMLSAGAIAAEVTVAVAANFTAPMKQIAADFAKDTGHRATLAFGSTGQFYAQIRNGAPFDVFLSADDTTPSRLAAENAAVGASQFTYAIGRLVLWSARPGFVDTAGDVLKKGGFDRIAITDPKLAPYGAAAVQTLRALGLHETLQPRFVTGTNINQTHQFVASGNAPLGFVALSQVARDGAIAQGSGWIVPAHLHEPIRQDAIVLERARGKPAAEALMKYLRGDKARAVIRAYGYDF